jgi:hypothetical protein
MYNVIAIFKPVFLLLFILQLFCSPSIIDNKSIKALLADIPTEEYSGDFSIEDIEDESTSDISIWYLHGSRPFLKHHDQQPKPGFLEFPYSPPEFI